MSATAPIDAPMAAAAPEDSPCLEPECVEEEVDVGDLVFVALEEEDVEVEVAEGV